MNFQDPGDDERELDRLLGRAEWPEAEVQQIARLRDRWRTLARRQRLRRHTALAMAAGILLAIAGLAVRYRQAAPLDASRPQPSIASSIPADTKSPPSETPPAVELAATPATAPARAVPTSREPTLHERMALLASRANRRAAVGGSQAGKALAARRLDGNAARRFLDDLITRLTTDPDAGVDAQLATIGSDLRRYQPWLLALAERGERSERVAAVAILGRVGTVASLPVLSRALADPQSHAVAIRGLCRLASAGDLKTLAVLEPRAELRLELIQALLSRRTGESIGLFLELVGNETLRSEALAASSSLLDPPVDLLVSFLENPRQQFRLAAAEALGSLPSADIAARLGDSVLGGIGRQEALMALLLSPDEQSAQFLAAARQDLYLVASVRAAEQQLRSLTLATR